MALYSGTAAISLIPDQWFRQHFANGLGAATPVGWSTAGASPGNFRLALFKNTSIAYNFDTDTGYNANNWSLANEITNDSGSAYVAGGTGAGNAAALVPPTNGYNVTTGTVTWTMGQAQWTTSFLSGYGALLYSNYNTVKYGIVFNGFGSLKQSSNGSFTVSWPSGTVAWTS